MLPVPQHTWPLIPEARGSGCATALAPPLSFVFAGIPHSIAAAKCRNDGEGNFRARHAMKRGFQSTKGSYPFAVEFHALIFHWCQALLLCLLGSSAGRCINGMNWLSNGGQ